MYEVRIGSYRVFWSVGSANLRRELNLIPRIICRRSYYRRNISCEIRLNAQDREGKEKKRERETKEGAGEKE